MSMTYEIYDEVNQILDNVAERQQFFEALKKFKDSRKVPALVEQLRQLVRSPSHLPLYDYVRMLVPNQLQFEYALSIPIVPQERPRLVRLFKTPGESFGFSVRGGFEHGIGLFVSYVRPDSQAFKQGLRVGDEIVRINGFTIDEAVRDEAVNLIRNSNFVELRIISTGMVPFKDGNGQLVWKTISEMPERGQARDYRVFLNMDGVDKFGCSICNGGPENPGVFIHSINQGGFADSVGLEESDQILEVNGVLLQDSSRSEAVTLLRSSKHLWLTIRRVAGIPRKLTPTPPKEEAPLRSAAYEVHDRDKMERLQQLLKEKADERSSPLHRPTQRRVSRDGSTSTTDEDEADMIADEIMKVSLEQQRIDLEKEKRSAPPPLLPRQSATSSASSSPQQPTPPAVTRTRNEPEMNSFKRKIHEQLEKARNMAQQNGSWKFPKEAPVGFVGSPTATVTPLTQHSFTVHETGGCEVRKISLPVGPLDIDVEGGAGSPLGGKIMISEIHPTGNVYKLCPRDVKKGDQLLMINGERLIGTTEAQARVAIQKAENSHTSPTLTLYLAVSPLKEPDDEMTYF